MKYLIKNIIPIIALIFLWCIPNNITAQPAEKSLPWDLWLEPETRDFAVIQNQVEDYFIDKGKGRGSGYKQWKRWEYLMNDHLTDDGLVTNFSALNFKAHQKYNTPEIDEQNRTYGGYWFPLAPTDGYLLGNSGYNPGIGRVNVIAFHPTSATTIYAGSPGGGLWKTTNEGTSWFPLTESIPSMGVSGIAIHPNNANIIYILTGDGDGGDTRSIGVLKTTNGGVTWNLTGLEFTVTQNVRGYKLVMKPGDPTTLFAVTTSGIYRTENSGIDWTLVRSGSFRDLEFKPGNAETIYACRTNVFYRSTNGGDTWSSISSGLPSGESRVALAVSANNPNYVYYLAGGGGPTGSFKGLYRSTNSGSSFSTIITSPNILDSSLNGNDDCSNGCDQAGYDLAIAVDPNDADEVITGGINVWRNEDIDLGQPWNIISHWKWTTAQSNGLEYTHADIHELVFQDNNRIWCGSDGGVWLSTNDGQTWTDKTSAGAANGLIGTQFYRIAGTDANSSILIGGTQDNGSNRWSGGNDITHFDGADGMDCMINQSNSAIQYHMRQRGGLRKSTNSGTTHSSIKPGNSNGGWVTPVDMDHGNSNEIWVGYVDTIYRSTNSGSSWTAFIPGFNGDAYRYIWCAPSNSSVIYAATDDRLWRSGNNGSSWSNITGTLPVSGGINITGVTTDLDNSGDIWVSLSGYSSGNKVYRSLNAGASWTNYSGGLPNVPINCVTYDDNQVQDNAVYVGTDIGIFYRDGTMSDWVPFRNGLPTVAVMDIEVHVGSNKLRAGTFGRGIWSSNLYSACPGGWGLTNANMPGVSPEGNRYYQASGTITSTRDVHGGVGTEVYYRAGNFVQLNEGFRAHLLDVFRATTGPCTTGIPNAPLTDGSNTSGSAMLEIEVPEVPDGEYSGNQRQIQAPAPSNGSMSAIYDSQKGIVLISLQKPAVINVGVINDGKEIERLIFDKELSPGDHELPISFGELSSGRYELQILSTSEKQLIPVQVKSD